MSASMFYEYSSHLYNSRRRSSIGEEEWKEKEKKEESKPTAHELRMLCLVLSIRFVVVVNHDIL